MGNDIFKELDETFGAQEGICEVGIFALAPDGWKLLSRKKYTQFGSASSWAQTETQRLQPLHPYRRYRMSIATKDDPKTLDDVLADYEERRKAGDPQYNELSDDETKHPSEIGECECVVCVAREVGKETKFEIAARRHFASGWQATDWGRLQQDKLMRKQKDLVGSGLRCLTSPKSDEEILKDFGLSFRRQMRRG